MQSLGIVYWFVSLYIVFVFHNMHMASMYLHRSIGHGSVVFHPWVALVMQAYLNINLGADAFSWFALHPIHHRNPDGEEDFHSPWDYESLWVGFCAVLFGTLWLHHKAMKKYEPELAEARTRYVPTAYDRLVVKLTVPWLHKPITSFGFMGLSAFTVAGTLCGHPALGALLWVLQAATSVLLFGLLNSWGHMAREAHPKAGHALDLPDIVSPLFGGDNRHFFHHIHPGNFFSGWADTGGWIIRGFMALGLAWLGKKPAIVHVA